MTVPPTARRAFALASNFFRRPSRPLRPEPKDAALQRDDRPCLINLRVISLVAAARPL